MADEGFLRKEGVAKLALKAKFDDFGAGPVSRKLTYPIGHRRFARNPDPAFKRANLAPNGVLQLPRRIDSSKKLYKVEL